MTQPDGYDPGNFAPLSVTSQKTQEDWENEIRADLAPAFNPLEVAASWIINSIQGLIDTIIEALTGLPVVGGALEDVFDALNGLWNTAQSALDGVGQLAWNLLNDPVGTLGQIPMMLVDGLESTIDGILDALQQVPIIGDVIRIISGLGSRLFGFIPLANIADEPQTLLWNPGFTGAVSLEPGSGWSWDSTVYRTGGDSEPGSAKAVADGTLKALRSNSASVAAGKKLPVEVHVLADGLTGTGDLLQLGLLFFDGDTQVDSIIVDSVGVPSDPHSWAAGVAGARMATLSGEVTIPEGVNRVQMRLIVTANATAGTVWWDDADMKLSGLLQQSWVDGLPQALQDIIGFAQSIIDTVVQAITGVPVVGDFLGELFDAVDSLFNDAQDALGGLADLAWDLLNDPISVIGTIPQTLVSGLTDALNALSSAVSSVLSDLQTLASNLLAAPATVIGNLFDAVIDSIGNTIGWLLNGLFGAFGGGSGGDGGGGGGSHVATAADVVDQAAQVANTANTAQFSTETLSGYFNTPRQIPAWLGYRSDDVAFAHTLIDGTSTPSLGQLILVPITVQQDRIYEAIKFGIDGTSMGELRIGLYALNHDTGDLAKVLDLGDCKSHLDTSYDQQIVPLPEAIGVQKREVYYIAFLQLGGTAAPMHRWSSTNNWVTGLYPRWIGNAAAGSWTALPTLLSSGDVGSGTKYWAALGDITDAVAPGTIHYSDGFNRPDAASLGPSWTPRGANGVAISNGRVIAEYATTGPGATTPPAYETYIGRLETLSQKVKGQIISVTPGARSIGSGTTYVQVKMGLRGDGFGRSVVLRLYGYADNFGGNVTYGAGASIVTNTSYAEAIALAGGTTRVATTSGTTTQQGVRDWLRGTWEFTATGNTYTAYRDGIQVVQWVDSGNAYALTNSCTELGLGTYADTAIGAQRSILFDNWEGMDL